MPTKPGMSADGDALFTRALMTVCKSADPRDGGAAIGALADWVQEQLANSPWLALCDHEGTGAVLIVQNAGNGSFSLTVVDPVGPHCTGVDTPAAELKDDLKTYLREYWE